MTLLLAQSDNYNSLGIASFLPFLLIGIIFYILIIRPQSNEKKKYQLMLEKLKKGDKILTRGGLYCTIVSFQGKNDNKVIVNIGSDIKIHISRSYIVGLANKTKEEA